MVAGKLLPLHPTLQKTLFNFVILVTEKGEEFDSQGNKK